MSESIIPKQDESSGSEKQEDIAERIPQEDLPNEGVASDASQDEIAAPISDKLETLAAELESVSIKKLDKKNSIDFSQNLMLGVLLLIVALGFSGFAYYGWSITNKIKQIENRAGLEASIQNLNQNVHQNQVKIDASVSATAEQIQTAQKQLLGKLEADVGEATKTFRNLASQSQQQVDMLQKRVDGHQQRLLTLSTTSREDWMLAEAEYLLKLANQRVLLERTSENAVSLLDAADRLVAQVSAGTGDAELFAIRKAISRDLTALKLIDPVDREGAYLRLQALADQIEQLPRVPELDFSPSSSEDSTIDGADADPQLSSADSQSSNLLHGLWLELKDVAGTLNQYIKIEDSAATAKPLIDQHLTQVAGLNVRLLLEQAQIALLKESPVIYSASLNKASEQVARYYIETSATREFQQSISSLSVLDIAPTLPDISKSLQLLHAYIRQLHKLQGEKEGQL